MWAGPFFFPPGHRLGFRSCIGPPAYQELTRPLAEVLGAKTATEFEALRVYTVGDLVRHLPRRYFGGTESSNLGELQIGEEAAVVAFVGRTSVAWGRAPPRLTGTITDGRAVLPVVFFGRQHNITWWQQVLQEGRRGIFAGKVTSFDGRPPQLTNPPTSSSWDRKGRSSPGRRRTWRWPAPPGPA